MGCGVLPTEQHFLIGWRQLSVTSTRMLVYIRPDEKITLNVYIQFRFECSEFISDFICSSDWKSKNPRFRKDPEPRWNVEHLKLLQNIEWRGKQSWIKRIKGYIIQYIRRCSCCPVQIALSIKTNSSRCCISHWSTWRVVSENQIT